MQEELNQFERNKVGELVHALRNMNIIGIKWVYKNKMDEIDSVIFTTSILQLTTPS